MASAAVLYRGSVQGVGFRYTTVSIASGYQVTGYVKNLPDGAVELVAEGSRPEVEAFLAAIDESRLGECIRARSVRWGSGSGRYGRFTILH